MAPGFGVVAKIGCTGQIGHLPIKLYQGMWIASGEFVCQQRCYGLEGEMDVPVEPQFPISAGRGWAWANRHSLRKEPLL
jgi:hypothetical protein